MTKNAEEYLEKIKGGKEIEEVFEVQSSSDPSKKYSVIRTPDGRWYCDCMSFKYGNQYCKHINKIKENYGKQ